MGPDDQAPRTRGAYAKGVARRQEILDRAIEVFAQRGGSRTSLRAIAQEVGVTHAALTHYFGSLDELLVAVYRESEQSSPDDAADEAYTAEAPAAPNGPPSGATESVSPAEMMRISAVENREIPGLVQLYSSLVASAVDGSHPSAHAFVTSRFARLRDELAERVRDLQASGAVRSDIDPGLAAALVIAASDGLQTQWLLDPSVDHEAALRLLDGLLAPPR
ncbi:TetR/AcrR family transcriptional regulator [Microbacterium dextranolyticum]|uniref:TetR family transcriptional regulator n=1 Tax=Microbacterium dextranolyticum TaxID=36806 RepID=A0A9W6HJX7_9MICO|nr:TetR/AcrR family transcriptional regulator [Microbacterium dextranolyticum]MBM7461943.1 AcrR family transcriptional regulator [Microbacterium dextranolyticum]GLJ94182.1 TetR family transcriptional regulator [Microbacterium dextranolyticum]